MTHTVHVGDRAPIVMTDTATGRVRRFGEEGVDTVEARTAADLALLVAHVPGAYEVPQDETPEDTEVPEGQQGQQDVDSPSTPSGRGRGRTKP